MANQISPGNVGLEKDVEKSKEKEVKKLGVLQSLMQKQRAKLVSTPEGKTRKTKITEEENASEIFRVLALKKLARAVKKVQDDRQHRLEATGNESLRTKVRHFRPKEIKKHLEDILSQMLSEVTYDPVICGEIAKTVCDVIKDTLKTLKYPRYKFISNVVIGKKGSLSVFQGSGFLWNFETDNYANFSYQNETLIANATVFAVFKD